MSAVTIIDPHGLAGGNLTLPTREAAERARRLSREWAARA